VDPNALRILLTTGEDGEPIWFLPDGRLFLATGDLYDAPRRLSLDEARAWWALYRGAQPRFEAPILPDDSDGYELVMMIHREWNRAKLDRIPDSATPVPLAAPAPATVPAPAGTSEPTRESAPALVNPGLAAICALDALALLRCKANEAGALALLLADAVKLKIKNADGWQDFDGVPGFEDGLHGLAHTAAFRLSEAVDERDQNMQPMIKRLQSAKPFARPSPVGYEAGKALLVAAGIDCPQGFKLCLESAVEAMSEIILLAAKALDERAQTNHAVAEFTTDALKEAFDKFWSAKTDLREAAVALVCSQNAEQRQAA
jgi:hypothetical protein